MIVATRHEVVKNGTMNFLRSLARKQTPCVDQRLGAAYAGHKKSLWKACVLESWGSYCNLTFLEFCFRYL